ncbi:MAG TPA: hypothetical protein P5567_01090 [Kiritimatiellia bacterium]|nr:hypothetical protein [Kiritimatiellia bacterium]HRZ11029.1 hypothetical protein [Kiritimatiellia bacterium]HSA18602.1 hypothetical protein [Kiritimatiellia bacterium]
MKLEEKLAALEEIQTRMLQASTPEEKRKLTESLLPLMGEVIQLNRADRQYRMTELARSLGLSDANAVRRFMGDVETIYRETQRDLAPFFSQGGPYHPSAPEPYRTEPIPVVGPGQPPQ